MKSIRVTQVGVLAAGLAVLFATMAMPKPNAAGAKAVMRTTALAQRHDKMRIHEKRDNGQWNSTNWSGYAVTGTTGSATDVKGSWVVPTVNCSLTPTGYSSFWVGIDGFSSNTVEQIGTDSDCVSLNGTSGTPTYYAWFEFYPGPFYEILFPSGVRPGDTMTAQVQYGGALRFGRHGKGSLFIVTIADVTQNESYSTRTVVYGAQQSSAEWIAEAPASNSGVLPLADFNQVAFGSATATLQSLTGSIGSFGTNVQQLTMVGENVPHAIKAQPSSLNGQGDGFSVAWLSPGP